MLLNSFQTESDMKSAEDVIFSHLTSNVYNIYMKNAIFSRNRLEMCPQLSTRECKRVRCLFVFSFCICICQEKAGGVPAIG